MLLGGPPSKVLVTGGAGFVGTYLRALLEELGHRVVVIDIANESGDVRSYDQVRNVVDRLEPDYILHLAALSYVPESTSDPRRAVDVTVGGTLNVLEAVRHTASRARVLITGTSEEYGYHHALVDELTPTEPTTPYGVTKLAASQLGLAYWKTYGLPVVVTRAFNHTGPGHAARFAVPAFTRRAVEVVLGRTDELVHGNLDSLRSYTDVRDVVRAYVAVVDSPPGVYNVGTPRVVDLRWVLGVIRDYLDVEVPTRRDERLYRPVDASFPDLSFAKIYESTGWQPKIAFERTIHDMIDHWREKLGR